MKKDWNFEVFNNFSKTTKNALGRKKVKRGIGKKKKKSSAKKRK